jgi:hypothetical protein
VTRNSDLVNSEQAFGFHVHEFAISDSTTACTGLGGHYRDFPDLAFADGIETVTFTEQTAELSGG